MHKVIDNILSKEVSRKEFLGLVGASILSLIGITAMLKNIDQTFSKSSKSKQGLNYGDDLYGGVVKTTKDFLGG
jgi:hypothetical protein